MNSDQATDVFLSEAQPQDSHTYGLVRAINEDSSYQVQLNKSSTLTRCANFCTAMVGDLVKVVINANGKCDAIGRLGGEIGGGGEIVTTVNDASNYVAGKVFAHAGTNDPIGALLCDGRAVSRTTYWELFAAIGTTYGAGDGSSTFNLPNIESRTIIGEGTGASGTEYALGATGGEEKHTLTVNEMPKHKHDIPASDTQKSGTAWVVHDVSNYLQDTGVGSTYTGGDQPHNNMQPYIVMRYFITTGKGDPASGINPADYVVEWGETDGWRWEKWASGKAECWGKFTTKTVTSSAWGSLYEIAKITSQPYPFEFAEIPHETATARVYGYYTSSVEVCPTNIRTTTQSCVYVALRPTTCPADLTTEFEIHAIGKWKDESASGGTETIAPTIAERFEALETDYIVAEGASGSWKWRKWANGEAECWGVFYEEGNTPYTTWNNMPFRYTPTWAFPFKFIGLPSVSYAGYIGSGFAIDARGEATESDVRLFFATSTTGSENVEAHIQARGRWK